MIYIDADILVYRVGFGCKDLDLFDTLEVMDNTIKGITTKFEDEHNHTLVISGKSNFRYDVAVTAPYKGTRKADKPVHYYNLREYVMKDWKAVETQGIEADDYIGIHCTKKDIIATLDKDLLMIPALGHYNFVKDTLVKVTKPMYYFWLQMLTGDPSDNIKGLTGIGAVKAARLLHKVKIKEMKDIVFKKYEEEFGEQAKARFHENGQLLWILRDENKTYLDYI